jgi:formylmethanofuran dehydrogenase subunit E
LAAEGEEIAKNKIEWLIQKEYLMKIGDKYIQTKLGGQKQREELIKYGVDIDEWDLINGRAICQRCGDILLFKKDIWRDANHTIYCLSCFEEVVDI